MCRRAVDVGKFDRIGSAMIAAAFAAAHGLSGARRFIKRIPRIARRTAAEPLG